MTTSVRGKVAGVKTKRAIGYSRVSDASQATERNVSLETQQAHIEAFCKAKGFVLLGQHQDVMSGRRDDRREYQRAVERTQAGEAEVIVVQYLDRFGRNPREILRRIWSLEEAGISVEATDEDIKEEMLLLVRAGMAGAESRKIGQRTKATLRNAVMERNRHTGRRPYGFRGTREILTDGKARITQWDVDEAEAAVIRRMVDFTVRENMGFGRIADRLNDEGVPVRADDASGNRRTGPQWTAGTVSHILQNPVLKGVFVYGRGPGNEADDLIEKQGILPAILTDEEWNTLQQRLAIRREKPRGRSQSSDYLLTGVLRCGYCGGPMAGKRSYQRHDRIYRKYSCSRHRAAKAFCAHANYHPAPELEAAVLAALEPYADSSRVRDLLKADDEHEYKARERELLRMERRLVDLDAAFARNLDRLDRGVINEAEFAKLNAATRQERETLTVRREELASEVKTQRDRQDAARELPGKLASFLEGVKQLEPRLAKARLQEVVKAVRVTRDGVEIEWR